MYKFKIYSSGFLSPQTKINPLLSVSGTQDKPDRHFSSFPLTSHLHTPTLRLISRHPLLSVKLTFLRVPEIHDEFEWDLFITRRMTVADAIAGVCEQLGLAKSLPGTGGAAVDYAIEVVWKEVAGESCMCFPDLLWYYEC